MSFSYYFQSARLYFREVREADVDENYYAWLNDPEVNSFLESRFIPRSLDNIRNYVRMLDGNEREVFFAMCLKESDRHIGNIKIGPINWYHRSAEIGLMIGDKGSWGKGYATEAIGLIVEYGFRHINLYKLLAGCYASNQGSKNAFLKNGFKQEGLVKERCFYRGQREDVIMLGLTEPEWRVFNATI